MAGKIVLAIIIIAAIITAVDWLLNELQNVWIIWIAAIVLIIAIVVVIQGNIEV